MESLNPDKPEDKQEIIKDMQDLSLGNSQDNDNELSLDSYENESQIRSALNQQTIIQYRQYAAEQHPKESHKQEELIKQLQEQYFQQYITQVYEMQKIYQQQQIDQLKSLHQQQIEDSGEPSMENIDTLYTALPLVPANLWTRKDIAEFKADILRSQRECCIKIGSLSTATVRVPTHPDGRCVFWEFATDHYDLGFGVYFEWNVAPADNITVHISESSDEDDEGEDGAGPEPEDGQQSAGGGNDPSGAAAATGAVGKNDGSEGAGDLEKGSRSRGRGNGLPCDELIPVYRRDCHTEVYCGSHAYPGRGTYVLKFDNSYSVWRSKWLYYRVYYTK